MHACFKGRYGGSKDSIVTNSLSGSFWGISLYNPNIYPINYDIVVSIFFSIIPIFPYSLLRPSKIVALQHGYRLELLA